MSGPTRLETDPVEVMIRGGHSTVHVVAADSGDLEPLAAELRSLGSTLAAGDQPPMLAVDVRPEVDLAAVRALLDRAVSMSCAYAVACDQHSAADRPETARRT